MPPTGLQRDPYGVDTEGATIPRLKPWVTPTQPPRGYNPAVCKIVSPCLRST